MSEPRYFATRSDGKLLIVEVLQPVGSLADDSVLHELDCIVRGIRETKPKAAIVDFHQIAYFGSSLLEALRAMWRELEPFGSQMVLCNLSPVGREIILLAKFDHVWSIADDVAAAKQQVVAY
jgi:anti-anti-sigma regulatory factor